MKSIKNRICKHCVWRKTNIMRFLSSKGENVKVKFYSCDLKPVGNGNLSILGNNIDQNENFDCLDFKPKWYLKRKYKEN